MLLASSLAGCTPEMVAALLGSGRASVPVYFIRAEGLEPPSAGKLTRTFKPAALFSAGADGTTGPQVFEFQVVLAVESAVRVEMQFADNRTAARTTLERITPPPQSSGSANRGSAISDAVRQRLAAGGGVFWHIGPDGGALEQRFGVILSAAVLGPQTRLEFFTRRTSDGAPIGRESIELVPDFFYLAVLGDSLLWGNGLEDRDKIPTRVAREIEQRLGRRVVTQLFAQSGATIVPGPADGVCTASCNGEVPFVSTCIMTQVGLVERPELIELALVDGCANDISIPTLLSPQTTDAELESLSVEFCHTAMIDLLRLVRTTLPNAAIVVPGYYAMVSEKSSTLGLRAWEVTRGAVGSEGDAPLVEELAHQSALFDELSTANLQAAVADVQAGDPASRIAFVDSGFGPANAAFAADTWLWGLTSENTLFEDLNLIQALNLDLFPEDPVQSVRLQLCFDPSNSYTLLDCLYVSLGHPNPAGAGVYARGIIEALNELGLLPTPP